jgi:glucose-1-phosphate thymidylyltransferase
MTAIILCAGFATRMHPLTEHFPKSLLEVGGKPVLDHLTEQIMEFGGLESIYVVTNNRFFPVFLEWAEEREKKIAGKGVSLHIYNDGANEPAERLGAAGDLAFVLNSIHKLDGALVAAGDNIFTFSLRPYWETFVSGDKNYVLAVKAEDPEKLKRTGVLELGEGNRVTAFHEKPERPPSEYACPALYFLKPDALALIDEYLATPQAADDIGLFISYLAGRSGLYALIVEGDTIDIGTIESYENAKSIFD